VGWISRVLAAGSAYCNDLAEVRDGLFVGEGNTAAKLSQCWLLVVLLSGWTNLRGVGHSSAGSTACEAGICGQLESSTGPGQFAECRSPTTSASWGLLAG